MNTGKVFLTDKLAKRIDGSVQSEAGPILGYLLGFYKAEEAEGGSKEDVHIVGAIGLDDAERLSAAHHQVSLLLPPGLSIVGIFIKSRQASYRTIVEQMCQLVLPKDLQNAFSEPAIPLYAAEKDTGENSAVYWFNVSARTAETATAETPTSAPLQNSVMFRLQASMDLKYHLDNNPAKLRENIVVETFALRTRLLSPDTLYQVDETNILVNGEGSPVKGGRLPHKKELSCRDFLTAAGIWEKFGKKKNNTNLNEVLVKVNILEDLTGTPVISCAPVIHHQHGAYTLASVPIALDVMCYVHDGENIVDLWAKRLQTAIDRQLEAITNCLLAYSSKGDELFSPVPYHFKPEPLEHIFTLVYPDKGPEDKLAERRRAIQHDFLLSVTRPYTKPTNRCSFPNPNAGGGYLTNVHEGLPASQLVPGGETHLVDGTYAYHHYMQDRINDDGWGCAYRSLQTIVSWFRFQGYTEKAVPSHREIQQILVDIGDKAAKFVGTNDWIGSMEVSYVLNTLLEVDSKTLFVSSGAEMANKGRELAQHFDTQGTPVMIGGGVLAHTILGVCFNDTTGELKFLILDPHYKGGEDLKVIQDKGWCGWKGVDFWAKNSFYNMCMPQCPAMV